MDPAEEYFDTHWEFDWNDQKIRLTCLCGEMHDIFNDISVECHCGRVFRIESIVQVEWAQPIKTADDLEEIYD